MFVHGSESLQLFLVVWIFMRYPGVICYSRQVLSEGHKNYFKDWCLMNSQPTFLFFSEFKLIELWPFYQKQVNQIIFTCTTLQKLAFQIIKAFVRILQIFPWIKLSWYSSSVRQIWMTQLILTISCPLIWKDSSIHMHGIVVYVTKGLPFTSNLCLENSAEYFLWFWLNFDWFCVILLFPLLVFFVFVNSFLF